MLINDEWEVHLLHVINGSNDEGEFHRLHLTKYQHIIQNLFKVVLSQAWERFIYIYIGLKGVKSSPFYIKITMFRSENVFFICRSDKM